MASPMELLFSIPAESAKAHLAAALQEQGFTVAPSASGGLLVKRGSLGTTLVAGAFAGDDMHVEFGVEVTETPEGALAQVRRSNASGFLKGGAIGAAKTNDVIQTALHRAGARLAQQGVLAGTTPSAESVQAAPAPYLPPPVDYAGRTNVVAIVSLVLGFLVPIGGIIAGAVALAQVKRTGEKGRGLAIAGIVVGSLATLLLIGIVAVAVIVGFAASSQTSPPVTAPQSSSAPEASPAPEDGAAPEGGADEVDVFSLQVGDCINDFGTGQVTSVETLDCAQAHDYEAYAEITIPGDAYPGDEAISAAVDEGCLPAFDAFVGLAYQDSQLDFTALSPSEDSWQLNDDRLVTCLIYDPAGQTSGSLAGAAR